MSIDPNVILATLTSAAGVLVLLLYRGLESRLTVVENTSEDQESADSKHTATRLDLEEHSKRDEQQFSALQVMLREFRAETREQFTTLRSEANDKRAEVRNELITYRTETNNKLEKLSDQMSNLTRTRKR